MRLPKIRHPAGLGLHGPQPDLRPVEHYCYSGGGGIYGKQCVLSEDLANIMGADRVSVSVCVFIHSDCYKQQISLYIMGRSYTSDVVTRFVEKRSELHSVVGVGFRWRAKTL